MIDDANLISLIENDIISFEDVSRFPEIGLSGNLQRAMGRDIPGNGIKITADDDGLTISCGIMVYFGVNIPQLCYDIQTRVKGDVEKMSGLTVKAVNIQVEGIDKRDNN